MFAGKLSLICDGSFGKLRVEVAQWPLRIVSTGVWEKSIMTQTVKAKCG